MLRQESCWLFSLAQDHRKNKDFCTVYHSNEIRVFLMNETEFPSVSHFCDLIVSVLLKYSCTKDLEACCTNERGGNEKCYLAEDVP